MKATLEKVRGGLDATVVIVHDDGDLPTCRFLLSEYEKNGLSGTIAMVADRITKSSSDELNTEAVAEWQGLLEAAETDLKGALLALIRKDPFSSFAASFIRMTGFSFLQSHKNPARSRRSPWDRSDGFS